MAKRRFIDRQGADWTVMDVSVAPNRFTADGWLCFVAAADGKRVRLPMDQAPANWKSMHRFELSRLLDDAFVATGTLER